MSRINGRLKSLGEIIKRGGRVVWDNREEILDKTQKVLKILFPPERSPSPR